MQDTLPEGTPHAALQLPGTFTAVTSSAVGASEHLKPEVWSLWSADSLGRRNSKHTLYSKQSSNDTRFVCTRDLAENNDTKAGTWAVPVARRGRRARETHVVWGIRCLLGKAYRAS
jgi:hypothetical protein